MLQFMDYILICHQLYTVQCVNMSALYWVLFLSILSLLNKTKKEDIW